MEQTVRSRHPERAHRTFLLGGMIVVVLAACSPSSDAGPSTGAASEVGETGETPNFVGPYAAEYERIFNESESTFVRDVLRDEQITDAEFSEMTKRLTTCLADNGIEFQGYDEDGAITTSLAPNPDDTHAIFTECSEKTGEKAIGALYSVTRQNPENLDIATITAECLVRSGTVPPQYDADDYTADTTSRFADFGALEPALQEALTSCSSDPLSVP